MGKEVLVCIAELVWSGSGSPERGDRYFYYVDDGKKCVYSNKECVSIKELAEELNEGIFLSGPLTSEDKIIYEPPVPAVMTYVDGFFGRPAIPSEGYYYKPLKEKQIEQLKKHLARLRRN
jgi:hypothetical protein